MKKIFKKALSLSLIGTLTLVFTSCVNNNKATSSNLPTPTSQDTPTSQTQTPNTTTDNDVTTPTTTVTPAPTTTVAPAPTTTVTPAPTTTVAPTPTTSVTPATTSSDVVKYTISFSANGGSGTMADVANVLGEYTLPQNAFTAPDGKEFKAWLVGNEEKDPNTKINVTANVEIKAVWKDVESPVTNNLNQTAKFDNVPFEAGQDSKGNAKNYIVNNFKIGDITLVASSSSKMEISDNTATIKDYEGKDISITKAISTGGKSSDTRHIEIDLTKYSGKATIEFYIGHTSKTGTARNAFITTTSAYSEGMDYLATLAVTTNTPQLLTKEVDCGAKYYLLTDSGIRVFGINVKEAETEKVSITFVLNNGQNNEVKQIAKGSKIEALSPQPSKSGKKFVGWFTDEALSNQYDFNSNVTSNLTLYAKYEDLSLDEVATITFVTNGAAETLEEAKVEKGKTYNNLPTVTKEGFRFDGWYTDETLQNKFNSNTTINSNMTLYAKFVQQVNVNFADKEGNLIQTVTIDKNGKVTSTVTAPKVSGFKFFGWKINNTDTIVDLSQKTFDVDTDLIATYTELANEELEVIASAGDQESLYVEFLPMENVDDYVAYVKEENATNFTKIDKQLIRLYKGENNLNYYRLDAVGLKAGKYSVQILPVIENAEQDSLITLIENLNVISYDRSGFAFTANQYNKTGDASGAYNLDGTLKAGAKVLYVSKDTAKKVEMDVVTSNKGATTHSVGLQAIIDAYQKGYETTPLAIRFIGKVSANDMDSLSSSGEGLQIKGKAAGSVLNLTLEGIGNDATIYGFGFLVRNSTNVEIRNLGFMTKMDDNVSLDTDNYNIWVHDCDFFYGKNGGGDHAKGDGALDVKGTMYATLSYNHFWDTGKTTLNSNGDIVDYVTYHHNWYDHSDSRHPRVRMSTAVHVYNNYYDGISKYGVGAAEGGVSIFVENNYFRNAKFPMLSSMQGSDVYAGTSTYSQDNATFSKEDGGVIKSFGNKFVGNYTYIPYNATTYVCKGVEKAYDLANTTSTVHFDAFEATSRDQQVPENVKSVKGNTSYSNFDTNSEIMYEYTVQTPDEAVETIKLFAGRVQGGDLKWQFDNAVEDTNYQPIAGLRTAIDNYETKLVKILGIESSSSGEQGEEVTPPVVENQYEEVIEAIDALPEANNVTSANAKAINAAKDAYDKLSSDDKALVTNVDKLNACLEALASLPQSAEVATFPYEGTFFTINGNNATNKGTSVYNGNTYSTCLKMESATKIEFTITSSSTLTIVFGDSDTNFNLKISKDGSSAEKKTSTTKVMTLTLEAGSYIITKGDTTNIFYMSVE